MSVHQDCRMYEHKYPEVDDVVMVQVGVLTDCPTVVSAYVSCIKDLAAKTTL